MPLSLSALIHDVHLRPLRTMAAGLLLALTATVFLVHAALVRGAREEAFRVAITVGEGHLTLLPAPDGTDVPTMIPDAGPLYTDPVLMRSGAQVLPRVTLPIHVQGAKGDELAILHGVERGDPQVALLVARHLTGGWPSPDLPEVVLGADLAERVGAVPGGVLALRLDRTGSKPTPMRVSGIVRTGRDEWDAHGAWSDLLAARVVRGIANPLDSEAVTHLAIFLPDPGSSGYWKDQVLRMGLPDFTEVREWWQIDLEPLRYTPQADPGVPWTTAVMAILVMGLVANLLLGPAPLPQVKPGHTPEEHALRLWVLGAIALQALVVAAFALLVGGVLMLTVRDGIAIAGSGPLVPQTLLPPSAVRLGDLLPTHVTPAWRLTDAVAMGAAIVVCTPLAGAVRLWRIGHPPRR